MTLIIIESSWEEPISDEEFDALAERVTPCLDERQATWVTSYMATDRRRRVCVFEARDAESVRQAYRLSGVKFDRVWAAEQIRDDDGDDD
jgi:hypothetical protein